MTLTKSAEQIIDRQDAASKSLVNKRELWDDAEKLFHNRLADYVSQTTKSQVFDPKLATLLLERGYRVMAQLPVGKVRGISKNDPGTSELMNLTLDKYVIPNANSQFDFLTKLRMVDIYSNLYGNFFSLVDWNVRENGYIGPDMWLLNIRDVFPQVGAVSIQDSDYIIVRTWKPLSFFEGIKPKTEGYKNIPEIITKLKGKAGSKGSRDQSTSVSAREADQYPEQVAAKDAGFFEVWSQFEKDKWIDYCVDARLEFREIDNPHDNGELPVECKYSIPLLDDFMGMGDFERGRSMQNVVNSIWNLYLDACKMSIFPPVILNKDAMASPSSFTLSPAAKWLGRGQVDNVARTVDLSPKGISTFNNTYQVANAAILNMFGTSDTSVTSQTEAGFGKTPKALSMQQNRENTRDNADRFYMEQFLKRVVKKMVNLVAKKLPKNITMRLFEDDIKQMATLYPDIKEAYNKKTGQLSIDSKKMGSMLYDYEIVPGSTYAVDQQAQQQSLVMMLKMITENPQLIQLIGQDYEVKFGELFKSVIANSGIRDWSKILIEKTDEEKAETILSADQQKFMEALQGQPNMNQVPPEQEQQPAQQPMQRRPVQQNVRQRPGTQT